MLHLIPQVRKLEEASGFLPCNAVRLPEKADPLPRHRLLEPVVRKSHSGDR